MPALPGAPAAVLPAATGSYSTANRRAGSCPVQRVYPWMLAASTGIAAIFCIMYLTKPVVLASSSVSAGETGNPAASGSPAAVHSSGKPDSLLPGRDRLPGESANLAPADPLRSLPSPSSQSPFEETNLRIQHVLTAETPGGDLSRIVLDVPVFYQSRELRWTPAEVAEARELLGRLEDHQAKTRQLREEGTMLLHAWNSLVERSIPAGDLRADSPSLPDNQAGLQTSPLPPTLDTTESIRLQPAGQ